MSGTDEEVCEQRDSRAVAKRVALTLLGWSPLAAAAAIGLSYRYPGMLEYYMAVIVGFGVLFGGPAFLAYLGSGAANKPRKVVVISRVLCVILLVVRPSFWWGYDMDYCSWSVVNSGLLGFATGMVLVWAVVALVLDWRNRAKRGRTAIGLMGSLTYAVLLGVAVALYPLSFYQRLRSYQAHFWRSQFSDLRKSVRYYMEDYKGRLPLSPGALFSAYVPQGGPIYYVPPKPHPSDDDVVAYMIWGKRVAVLFRDLTMESGTLDRRGRPINPRTGQPIVGGIQQRPPRKDHDSTKNDSPGHR